jgi:arsenate reductase (thioredoxin)
VETKKQRVLFLCTQNSARSQMAEGFLRDLAGDRFEAYSAGIDPTDEIHPCAVEAMSEVGIDISEQYPKGLRTYLGKMGFNYLIIVCARAEERCPKTFPGVGARFSWVFEDPRRDEEIPYDSMLERFRTVHDERDRTKDKGLAGASRAGTQEAKGGTRAAAQGAPGCGPLGGRRARPRARESPPGYPGAAAPLTGVRPSTSTQLGGH